MNRCFIVHAKRTATGKISGKLANIRVDDLLAHAITGIKNEIKFDLKLIDDVIIGCANQAGEDNRNLARMSLILAGLPYEVPGTTVNRLCASSLDALMTGLARITSGLADCLLIGGAESMTRAPYALSKADDSFGRNQKLYDTTFGWRFVNNKMEKMFPLLGMGETAEEVAERHSITREEQDRFALLSHQKAYKAHEQGKFSDEIIPIKIENKKETFIFDRDECVRGDTTLEQLAKLKPVFKNQGTVTAGNSSPMNDGASCLMIVSEEFLKTHQLTPLIEVTGAQVAGIHPNIMGLGPVDATQKLLKKYHKKISDFSAIELNEAFAAQSIGCIKALEIDPNVVNLKGGAISLGHALGNSGTRIVTTLAHIMNKDKNIKEGLATMCIGVGQGLAMSFRNC